MRRFFLSLTPLYLAYDRIGVIEVCIILLLNCVPHPFFPSFPPPLLRLVSVLSGSCPVSKQWQGQGWSPRVRHCRLPHSLRAAFMADGKDLDEPMEHWRRKIPRWGYRWHGIDTWNSRCESAVLMTWLVQGGEVVTGTFCYGCYLLRELMKPFRQIVSMFYRGRL